ncbi:universal stress protein [Arthrobacter oryzae]|uniref:Nucleotide-binding universal stress UspA family protein n=1 Tax=Arthrobacter oryzae TaxID=409290 RepID=A0A495FMK8_9MICC|nr:universal stress protein [Arthrobacter oryzae]RKR30460.1 nucleotide-binding universal stress UspA family protein [Arthrobacter oryzae]
MTNADPFVIVVGFDGSKQSRDALEWAIQESKYRDAELRVVTVWNKAPMSWYPALLETAAGEIVAEDSPEQQAEALSADAAQAAAGVNVVKLTVRNDSAASAILKAAREADLVVVGSRGHGGFAGLHIGSVSAQVASHSPCPVLVVRPKASSQAG